MNEADGGNDWILKPLEETHGLATLMTTVHNNVGHALFLTRADKIRKQPDENVTRVQIQVQDIYRDSLHVATQ